MISVEKINQGVRYLLDGGHADTARWVLDKLLCEFPDNSQAYHQRALLAHELGDNQAAGLDFRSAADLAPGNPQFQKSLGDFYHVVEHRLDEAVDQYQKVLALTPNDVDTLVTNAHLNVTMYRFDEAIVLYQKALTIAPHLEEARELLEKLTEHQAREQVERTQAITALKRVTVGQPDIVKVLNDSERGRITFCVDSSPAAVPPKTAIDSKLNHSLSHQPVSAKTSSSKCEDVGPKILHIMIVEKFMPSFIDFVDKHFERKNHQYVFIDKERYDYGLSPHQNVKFLNTIDEIYIALLEDMKKADKIIIHGLWRNEVDILLYFNQDLLSKCYWAMWGGDFYFPEKHTLIRKQVIKKMGHSITDITGDYELAKKWYGTKAEHHKCFSYLSNTYKDYSYLQNDEINHDENKIILIGNSATPSNSHFEIFGKIQSLNDDNITLICPLSYGNKNYAEKVLQAGVNTFGDKFKPLVKFIPPEEYIKILFKVDIAIFAHRRQQGMGNIRTLLGLGKKVYIRDDITSWGSLKEINVKAYSFNNDNIDFCFPEYLKIQNIENIKKHYSYERLLSDWKSIFKIDS